MPRDGLVYEGGRRFLRVSFPYDWLEALPWSGFQALRNIERQWGISVGDLEHRYTEENYGGLVAVFEVVRRVRP